MFLHTAVLGVILLHACRKQRNKVYAFKVYELMRAGGVLIEMALS
jgi:pentatricopeptide repeat protein